MTSAQSGTHFAQRGQDAMAWMVFGIRSPGGSRPGSVVAVAMSPLSVAGTVKYSVR